MSISFSGLASGLDTTSWVESLVALKRAKVTALQEEKETVLLSKDTLSSIRSFFSSFRSTIEKITDTKFNIVSMDLFAQNIATSANLNVLTASATSDAEEGTYKIKVDKLASKTNAVSNYKKTTTTTVTATATDASLLKHLGVTEGTVGVTVDGIKYGVAITESDTIATFIDKLKNIGVDASYNNQTGVFSMNLSADDIDDSIDNTGIVEKLHLAGVNEGYKTVDSLKIQHVEEKWEVADNDTKFSELGVTAGTLAIKVNNGFYEITIDTEDTLGEFISALNAEGIDASLTSEGFFTLQDAEIDTTRTTTNFITAMGLQTDIYSKTQATGRLQHQTVTTQTTTATSATLLKDIGEGIEITNTNNTVIVKNSNNEFTTITVDESTTIGGLLAEMSNAGLYAAIDSNGVVEITGGTITGGTFDAVSALGLETEPYTAMVTGNPLTETTVEQKVVTLQTRLVEDLGVTRGYLEVIDADGNKYYEKIYSGQTIADFMADMGNLGIYTKLDENTGILEITGGAFRTLDNVNDEVGSLIANATIVETDPTYQQGTNLLECLYGSGTISTEQISVASAYSRTRALTQSVTNVNNATLGTTLGNLGLNADGTAIFDVRGEEVTVNLTTDMTVQGLIDELAANGIEATWDSDTSRLTINNTTLIGGSSNLADVLNLTTEIAGKYVTSDALKAESTVAADATEATKLSNFGVNTTETVILNKEDGSTFEFTVDGETTLGELLTILNDNGVTAKLEDGILSIEGGYLENAVVTSALGLSGVSLGYSSILGNKISHTVTTTATGESTLGEIITALGTTDAVAGGYDMSFNSNALSVSATTTIDDLMLQIHNLGGSASVDSAGRLHVEGGALTGSVATALGISSVTVTMSVGATGEILSTITTVNADTTTKLGDLGITDYNVYVYKSYNGAGSFTANAEMTIGDLFTRLNDYGIIGTIENGVITLTTDSGNYISGGLASELGIFVNTNSYKTVTTGSTTTSTELVSTTTSITADSSTTLGDLGFNEVSTILVSDSSGSIGAITTNANMTIGDMLTAFAGYGISGTITDGVISLNSAVGAYVTGDVVEAMGITTTETEVSIAPGKTWASTAAVTYTQTTVADGTTTLKELGVLTSGVHLTKEEAEALGYTWVTTRAELTSALRANDATVKVMLGGDIDLSDGDWSPIANFAGTFDGNNYSIMGMTITNPTTQYAGFFANLKEGANVKNLSLGNAKITGENASTSACYLGVLAGRANKANINNVSIYNSEIKVNKTSTGAVIVGGIVGTSSSVISNSEVSSITIDVRGGTNILAGGAIGFDSAGLVSQTRVLDANFVMDNSRQLGAGGLIGRAQRSKILQSGAVVNSIEQTGTLTTYLGALIGQGFSQDTNPLYLDVVYYSDFTGVLEAFGDIDENAVVGDVKSATLPASIDKFAVYDADGNLQGTISVGATTTIDDILAGLLGYGISGTINNGQIVLNSTNGNYVFGSVAAELGIIPIINATSNTVGAAATSTAVVTYTQETAATLSDKVGDFLKIEASACDGVLTATSITGTTIGISTAEDLANLSSAVAAGADTSGKTFVLLDDIDLVVYDDWVSIGSGSHSFKGIFDGNGYTISHLGQFTSTANIECDSMGLFGYTEGATLKNIKLDNVYLQISNDDMPVVGALAGLAVDTQIDNVKITGLDIQALDESDAYIGGAVGALDVYNDTTINNVSVSGNITAGADTAVADVGGIVGSLLGDSSLTMTHLHSDVYMNIAGIAYNVGGLVGYYENTEGSLLVDYCANTGDLNITGVYDYLGGLFGYIDCGSGNIIRNSYNSDYSSDANYGGIFGTAIARGAGLSVEWCAHLASKLCYSSSGLYFSNIGQSLEAIHFGYFTDAAHWVAPTVSPAYNQGPKASEADLVIKDSTGATVRAIRNVENMTFEELFASLEKHGITCSISDGMITVNSTNGNYVDGKVWEKFGFEVLSTTTTVTTTTPIAVTSTAAVTYTTTTTADATTTLGSTKYAIDGTISYNGVTGNVIAISTAAQMQYLAEQVNAGNNMSGKTFVLTNDIDMSTIANAKTIGDVTHVFSGTFDGMGHTISGFSQSVLVPASGTEGFAGLFGEIFGATIKNFKFSNASISASVTDASTSAANIGVIAKANSSTISGIEVDNATFSGSGNANIGGILGQGAGNVTILNCSTSGTLSNSGNGVTGGILGRTTVHGCIIDNVQNDADINNTSTTDTYCQGGIIGQIYMSSSSSGVRYVKISNALNKGDINIAATSALNGAIVGGVSNVYNSYAYTIDIERTVNLGKNGSSSAADVIAFYGSLSPHADTKININCFYGVATSTSNTDDYVLGYEAGLATATISTNSARNLAATTLYSRVRTASYGWDVSKWAPGSSAAAFYLKTGDEYDIFICNGSGVVQKTLDLNGNNSIQDIVSGLQGYGECSFADGKISYTPAAATITVSGTGADTFVNSATELQKEEIKTLTADTTIKDLGYSGSTYLLSINSNGVNNRVTILTSQTVGELMTQLSAYGFECTIKSGKLYIKSLEGAYITSATVNLESGLKIDFANGKSYTAVTTTTTAYAGSTSSDRIVNNDIENINSSTKLSEIGVTSNVNITVVSNGTENIITLSSENTVGDVLTALSGYNISARVVDGKLNLQASDSAYISGMDSSLLNGFKLTSVSDLYTVKSDVTIGNTNSNTFSVVSTETMTNSTKLSDLGINTNTTITINSTGTLSEITFTSDKTIGDIITALASYDITASIQDGKLNILGNEDVYVSGFTATLNNALNLESTDVGGGTKNTYSNPASNTLGYSTTNTLTTDDTFADHGMTADGYIIIKQGINENLVSVKTTNTVAEILSILSSYDITGYVDNGKLYLSGFNDSYITEISSEVKDAMKLGDIYFNTDSYYWGNNPSNTLLQTVTEAATGTTLLQDLRNDSGNAPAGYELGLSTTSNAGNEFLTITFTATSTIYDVIDELAKHGLNASIDANGRFAVDSTTLTDFDIAGDLGTFLMDAYTKVYNEGSVNNVSTILTQQTEANMDDSTLLSKIGVTNGLLILYKDDNTYTMSIDNSKTIGDLRMMFAESGLQTSIIDGKLHIFSQGDISFASPAGGSNIISILGLNNIHVGDDSGEYEQHSKHLYNSQTLLASATMDNKLSDLLDSSNNSLGITAGQIYVYQDGTRSVVNIDTNETLQDLQAKLSQYGITMGISSDGKLYFDGNNNSYMTTDGLASGSASNILTKFNILNNWSTRYNSTSETLSYEVEEDTKVNGSTKLVDLQDADGNSLGITEGNYYVYQNGVRTTESISSDTTVDDFVSTLATYGMTASFDESGALSVGGYNETYLATAATAGDNTNAIDVLFETWNFTNVYTSNGLTVPENVTVAISETTKLADINVADPANAYKAGYITVIKNGVQTDIELTADDTVGDLMDELALYGFESVINGNGQLIIQNTGDSLLQAYPVAADASNALELLGIGLDDWVSTNTYESKSVTVTTTSTQDVSATRDTSLAELGVSTGEFYVYKDGVKYTSFVSSDETLGSLIDKLESFGIETSLVDTGAGAVLSIEGRGDSYVAKSTNNPSNIVEKLFTVSGGENYAYSGTQKIQLFETTMVNATEDTLLSTFNIASDPANGIIEQKAEGDLSVTVDGVTSTLKITADETIGSLLAKFKALGIEATLSDGNIVLQSGYKDFSINPNDPSGVTPIYRMSSLPEVIKLAYHNDLGGYSASSVIVEDTQTVIEDKTLSVAKHAQLSTNMGLLNITSGTLTVYRDGEKATINIDSNQTFDALNAQIAGRFGDVTIDFDEDGYLIFSSGTEGVKVEVGATTDTSNFSAITGVQSVGDGTVKSSRELYCVNSSSLITQEGLFEQGDVEAGTFKIGDATFEITDNTTIASLISQINATQDANATAYWDSVEGKLVIQSRTTGAALINIEAGTSNFTDVMGFTKSEWADADSDGNPDIGQSDATVTKMNVAAQQVGDNARFSINGTYYTSVSNTIGSDVSRINGVTINLKGISEGETTLTIERDKESIANAVSDVVDAYNELIENVDKEIAKGSPLDDQFTLKLLRNQIRTLMTSSISGAGVFKNLDAVGISLNAATAGDIRTDNINVLSFDKDKFIKAFDADRDALKDLLVGTDANLGIFQRVENVVENALVNTYGYFSSAENSYNKQISRLDSKIQKAQTALERYRERLEAKFASMDLLISQMQNQYSSFLSV